MPSRSHSRDRSHPAPTVPETTLPRQVPPANDQSSIIEAVQQRQTQAAFQRPLKPRDRLRVEWWLTTNPTVIEVWEGVVWRRIDENRVLVTWHGQDDDDMVDEFPPPDPTFRMNVAKSFVVEQPVGLVRARHKRTRTPEVQPVVQPQQPQRQASLQHGGAGNTQPQFLGGLSQAGNTQVVQPQFLGVPSQGWSAQAQLNPAMFTQPSAGHFPSQQYVIQPPQSMFPATGMPQPPALGLDALLLPQACMSHNVQEKVVDLLKKDNTMWLVDRVMSVPRTIPDREKPFYPHEWIPRCVAARGTALQDFTPGMAFNEWRDLVQSHWGNAIQGGQKNLSRHLFNHAKDTVRAIMFSVTVMPTTVQEWKVLFGAFFTVLLQLVIATYGGDNAITVVSRISAISQEYNVGKLINDLVAKPSTRRE